MTACIEKMFLPEIGSAEITAALHAAASQAKTATLGPHLTVMAHPEMRGAEVARCCVEVYVNVTPDKTAIALECWHKMGSDPYKLLSASSLNEAVKLALEELDCE